MQNQGLFASDLCSKERWAVSVSGELSEIELKRLDDGVALEITSSEGTRLLRWNGGGFH
jgi:hypothetical protein